MLGRMDDEGGYPLVLCQAVYNIVMTLNLKLSDSLSLDSHCFSRAD